MRKGQVLEGRVERLDFPGKGIVKVVEENGESGVCVVKNVLPGQKISFCVQKKRNGRGEGRLLQVLEKAEKEGESSCPHFSFCGGCIYHGLSYEEQCRLKEEQVKRLLDTVLCKQETWHFEPLRQSPKPFGYRNKMEFTFGDEVKDGPLALGLHKINSFYDIVTVSDCQIMDEDYRKILTAVRAYFAESGLPFFHRLRHTGYLRHLLVRKAAKTGEILIALITTGEIDSVAEKNGSVEKAAEEKPQKNGQLPDWQDFVVMLTKLPLEGKIAGVLHTINDSVADVVRSDGTRVLYGRDYFYEELLGLRFKVTEFSFFQTNSLGAELLYQTVRDYVGELKEKDKVVFDLYSGTGTIAQLMAPVAKKVVGVEILEEAVEAAKENATLNGLHNCEFIAGDVLKVLDEIEEKPDFIILDPPRDGIHPKALKKILAYGVPEIVYVSCKPTSLVRDLESFLEAGYRVEKAVCCDMFPWTGNIETVVKLYKVY